MKATIAQLDASLLAREWEALKHHIAAESPDMLLLPEMCFAPWFCAEPERNVSVWNAAVSTHERWIKRLPELGLTLVVGTAPRNEDGNRYNAAYLWTAERGIQWIHRKTYLPNDDGYWEANWYDRAPIDFKPVTIGELSIGLVICTEIWFMGHARDYGKRGIHLLLCPRSTPAFSNDKWLACGRTAAVVAGAFCLSSNHAGRAKHVALGGAGWICDPDGAVLALTSETQPFITLDVDLAQAEAAKRSYPRYVDDRPI
ncbi:MAG: carbon-nitrogen hydrolase family protein [Chloroflexota bacterium]|nr:carbon-nitrogen hydrolase family protein [Chloroflexota bacterium]MDE2909907.1 carbon-nitrogen hydrolase family protein [Chloroflexota bacterium]